MTELDTITGLGKTGIEKLVSAGINSVEELVDTSVDSLVKIGFSENKAEKIINAANSDVLSCSFISGSQIIKRQSEIEHLKFNVPDVDELLGGGIRTREISEFYGKYGSGKSQVVHQMAVNVQLPRELGGLDGGVIWIDTENTYRINRIKEMVDGVNNRLNADLIFEDVIDHIWYKEIDSVDSQVKIGNSLQAAADRFEKVTGKKVRLIIVDSLTAYFRAEFIGREALAPRQQTLHAHMIALNRFAQHNNAALIVTNQVQENPAMMFGDPTKPIGGNIVGHTSKVRCYLRKGKEGKRVLKLEDAPDLPDGEAPFLVATEGLLPLT